MLGGPPLKNIEKTQYKETELIPKDPPLDMGLVLFGFLVFPKVFKKTKKPSVKSKIRKKTKENQKNLRKNQKTKVFKGFRPTLGYGFGLVWFLGFPEGF